MQKFQKPSTVHENRKISNREMRGGEAYDVLLFSIYADQWNVIRRNSKIHSSVHRMKLDWRVG